MDQVIYSNRTLYDDRALAAMNFLAERTVQKNRTVRARILCFVLGVIGLIAGVLVHPHQKVIGEGLMLYGVILLIVGVSWHTFRLNSSRRQLPQGTRFCTTEFMEEGMTCTTEKGTTVYIYDQVFAIVEDSTWYVIFFDAGHGIILDKAGFTAGEPMMFKSFIGMHTQLPIQTV